MRRKVLFVESSRGGIGGSAHSLWTLVHHLDTERFEPIVLATQESPFWERFRAAGVPVEVWPSGSETARPDSGVGSGRQSLQQSAGSADQAASGSGMTVPSSEAYLRSSPLRRALSSLLRLLLIDLPRGRRLARHVKENRAHLLHANDRIGSNRFVVLGGVLAGRPVIQHERLSAPYRWTDVLLSGWTSATICVSSQVAAQSLRQGHRGPSLRVIPNAVDLLPSSPDRSEGSQIVVGMVGRLVEWKGQDLFLEAMETLAASRTDVSFVVAGQAGPATQPYEERLRAVASRPPLAGRVRFTGHVANPLALMREFSVLVVASRTPEPFGRTVIEAMSVGVPVVAPAAGGPAEIIEHERTGLLVPPNDAPALACAVERLLARPAWARQLADAGCRAVETRYDPKIHARAVEAVYDDILAAEG